MPKATHDPIIRRALASGEMQANAETGEVTYRGKPAYIKPDGYLTFSVERVTVLAHRAVWLSAHPDTPEWLQINHRNGRRWDNRLSNLELVTAQGNQQHRRGNGYAAVASTSDELDGNSVDPLWFEQVMALAASGEATTEQIQALKPERVDSPPRPYGGGRKVFRGR